MGSFNRICGITNLPISAKDKIYCFPLVDGKFACPPILGEYDDYGHIDTIEDNGAYKVFCTLFGDFEKWTQEQSRTEGVGSFFVHKDVLDTLVESFGKIQPELIEYLDVFFDKEGAIPSHSDTVRQVEMMKSNREYAVSHGNKDYTNIYPLFNHYIERNRYINENTLKYLSEFEWSKEILVEVFKPYVIMMQAMKYACVKIDTTDYMWGYQDTYERSIFYKDLGEVIQKISEKKIEEHLSLFGG